MQVATGPDQRVLALHRDSVIVDACNTAEWSDEYLERLVASGVTCAVKTLTSKHGARGTLNDIAEWLEIMDRHPDKLVRVTTVGEIEAAKASGRVGVVYAFQNAKAIEDDLRLLRIFYEMGVRLIQLTYNTRNYLGDGCLERHDGGLSDFGVAVVAEMNRLGIVVDLSHVSVRTSLEAIEASERPVVFSHSNCWSIVKNARNVTDEQIQAVAAKGGVVGLDVYLPHLSADLDVAPTLDDLMRHVDHIVNLVGADHLGFGLDLGEGRTLAQYRELNFPVGPYPTWEQRQKNKCRDIEGIEKFSNLTAALAARGYDDDDVRKILGGNFLRVFGAVWGA